ncbi:hypothetical protein CTAYLR_000563 [Chrysophaeum taylorii]|uniref:Protein ENHANCED DISEASE RESISTANCE 2 C-terminal domain-containing protein n=1 Tax=Chrysophaeum taylorii TaxID=2483200 RepID=A0AAD7XKB4_9STRA|nr:hypothetical protein CTAYLR_000563 [Chrysophaeum taylorii]
MVAAIFVVLLVWAILTKRVYVIRWSATDAEFEIEERPTAKRIESRKSAQRTLSAAEVHEYSGGAPRENNRLVWREGAYWSEPDHSGFRVRGATYLFDKIKIPSPAPQFQLLDCDLFDLPEPTTNLARFLGPRLEKLWVDYRRDVRVAVPFTFVVQLQVPGPPWKAFVMYFGGDKKKIFHSDTPFSRIATKFFQPVDTPSPDRTALHKWRNNTFKLIPRCVNAPFVVKRAVGEVPTLLGNKLQQLYFGTDSYFEVDVNISSSRVAQYTVGLALNYASVVICDLAFVLQGAAAAELPEVLAACMRIEHIVMKDATPFNPSNAPPSPSSLGGAGDLAREFPSTFPP